jgi:hypothetical protein
VSRKKTDKVTRNCATTLCMMCDGILLPFAQKLVNIHETLAADNPFHRDATIDVLLKKPERISLESDKDVR